MTASRYDLCILGAGPAGLAAAVRAHDLGKTVALIDGGPAGGAGIWDGALSSKTAWHLSGDFARARRTDRGYHGGAVTLAWDEVRAAVRAACAEAADLVERQLAYLAQPSAGGGRVDRIRGRGRFIAPDAVEVATADGPRRIDAARFLIAVGSRPRPLPEGAPHLPIDGERILTSDHVDHLAAPPRSLAIIGGGVVGCEYATIFGQFGATAVEILDRQPRILPFEDEDVATAIAARFDALGVAVHRRARLEALRPTADGVALTIRAATADGEAVVERTVERVLVAIGRVPDTAALGLDLAGVRTTAGGGVIVDGTRTSSPQVWAAGDATTDVMLVNMAEIEARHAVADMFGLDPEPIHYDAQSAIYFFSPELATVGLGEQGARQAGIPYRAAIISNRLLRRSIAMRATDGFVKLLARRDGRLLGLRVVGPQAGSCIQGVALLIARGGTLDELDRCVHPHPAVTEGVQEAARLLLGNSLYKPGAVGELARVVEG